MLEPKLLAVDAAEVTTGSVVGGTVGSVTRPSARSNISSSLSRRGGWVADSKREVAGQYRRAMRDWHFLVDRDDYRNTRVVDASPTGLGDGERYDLAANPPDPEKAMIILDGVPYFAADQPFGRRDQDVIKVGRDDGDQYYIYQATTKIGDPKGIEPELGYLLKLATDEYIKIGPKPS